MLVLGRKEGEVVRINVANGVSPSLTVGELFNAGPIEITVTRIVGGTVRLGIQADRRFTILRGELSSYPADPP